MSFTQYDFRDFDLMLRIQGEGSITHAELQEALGVGDARIAPRLSWMRRMGMLAYDDKRKLWTLSEGGGRVVSARKLAAVSNIEALPAESLVDAMAAVAVRYWDKDTDPMIAHMLRREFLFGTSPRRKG